MMTSEEVRGERRGSGLPSGNTHRLGSGRIAARIVDGVKLYGREEGTVRSLRGVSVAFDSGRLTAIMGPSGSGKSTLLHCLAGLDRLTSGYAEIDGLDLSTLGDRELSRLRRERVGFIFQAFNLVPTLTVAENVALPLTLGGRKPDRAWFDALIEITGLADRLDHRPDELSGGQQQRVAAARALLGRPPIVFADEPTGNLDSRAGKELLDLLRRTVDEMGNTVVIVTHDAVAASMADRVVFLADGRIVDELERPTVKTILAHLDTGGS